ncbi:MAG: shikimate kinase [Gammaproteobacteria bacterium]|nr:shikimate kinase [Gammaproteobacteria bacterium]
MVKPTHCNIVLIGMPGAGKSTVGVILAKRTARDFVDTDLLIQKTEKRSLQEILDADGYLGLRRIEERVLLSMELCGHVIATGGSAVYSDAAMDHLRRVGIVVFLDVDLDAIKSRVTDFDSRGIAKRADQSFEALFEERRVLYRKYADITIDGARLNQDQVCEGIRAALAR